MIKITHLQKNLWVESGILDNLPLAPNFLPLCGRKFSMETEIIKFAKQKAIEENPNLTMKTAQNSDKYKFIVGAMIEVFVEFYLKLLEFSNTDLQYIEDTSANEFNRGFDFIAKSGLNQEFDVQIQVKWREDPKHRFTRSDLFTMIDEARLANIVNKNLWLVVPSSKLETKEVLHYRDDFSKEYFGKMTIITGREIEDKICERLISNYSNPFNLFFEQFKNSIESVN